MRPPAASPPWQTAFSSSLSEYVEHYHAERNRQGKDNVLLFPCDTTSAAPGPCNAVSDWVGSCVITIRRRRDRAPRAQS